ncbi:MAG: hypothetical protein AB1610_05710 [Nitrospirota bacterium]
MFPFENFSEDKDALTFVMPALKRKLEARGVGILDDDNLEKILLKEKIRSTGYISKDIAMKIGKELNVEAILVGSINSFSQQKIPEAGFSARLVSSSDGSILWAEHASATGEDFVTILGLGKISSIDKLISKVADELFDSFTVSPSPKEKELTYTIAVMPFENKSKVRNAGMIATYMFIAELSKNKKFVPLEYGEVRRLVVDLRIRSKGELDFENTETIAEHAGVDGILVGTVELYNEGEGAAPPEAVVSARLIDTRTGRILWYDGYQYKGDDGIIMLDWGRIRSAEKVVYKVISKLTKEMSKIKWR